MRRRRGDVRRTRPGLDADAGARQRPHLPSTRYGKYAWWHRGSVVAQTERSPARRHRGPRRCPLGTSRPRVRAELYPATREAPPIRGPVRSRGACGGCATCVARMCPEPRQKRPDGPSRTRWSLWRARKDEFFLLRYTTDGAVGAARPASVGPQEVHRAAAESSGGCANCIADGSRVRVSQVREGRTGARRMRDVERYVRPARGAVGRRSSRGTMARAKMSRRRQFDRSQSAQRV